jgi:hypothetical protein
MVTERELISDHRAPARRLINSTTRKFPRANRSVGAQIILYTALIAGTGNPILAQDQSNGNTSTAVVRSKIEALLGAMSIPPAPTTRESARSLSS